MRLKAIWYLSVAAFSFLLIAPLDLQSKSPPPIPQLESPWVPSREISAYYGNTEWLSRCSSEIDLRIQGKTASEVLELRDDNQHLTTSWAYGINLTAVTLITGGPRGVAVTPRHVLYTKHFGYHPWPGQTVKFLTMDNRIISRVVDQVKYLGSPNNTVIDKDVAIVRLKEDLPGSITPMKLIAPEALPDVAQRTCPVIRIDQNNKALLVAAYTYSSANLLMGFFKPTANSSLPKLRNYAPYYEDMIMGDSSSPSILIYRDTFGVTPFLMSQVTYGRVGVGPSHTALASEIQSAVQSFGDTATKYQLNLGPYEFSGHKAPTCSISARRLENTETCLISVQGSGDSTTGNPILYPNQVVNWNRNGSLWSGATVCSIYSNTTYSAQLSGPGGIGPSCESGEIKLIELPPVPWCSMSVVRQGTSATCNISVTRTQGEATGNPSVTPVSPQSWTPTGSRWEGVVSCSQTDSTNFLALLSGPGGSGPTCSALVEPVPKPACTLVVTRNGTSGTCTYVITSTSPPGTITNVIHTLNRDTVHRKSFVWNNQTQSQRVFPNFVCAANRSFDFTAIIEGPGGQGSCSSLRVPVVRR